MSKLRPELGDNEKRYPCMSNGTAYMMILSAVKHEHGLVHGKLHANGEHCAIGSYFTTNNHTALPSALIDEVAAVNDSVPHLSKRARKLHIAKWLRWKLDTLGYPGMKPKVAKSI